MPALINGIVTQSLTATSDTLKHPLGTQVMADDGGLYEYVQASESLSQYQVVAIYGNGTARQLETSIANAAGVLQARRVGFAQTSIASAYYGWVARSGPKLVFKVADDCAAGALLFTTATAGELDDATVSGCHLPGVQLTTTASLATAITGQVATPAFVGFYSNPA